MLKKRSLNENTVTQYKANISKKNSYLSNERDSKSIKIVRMRFVGANNNSKLVGVDKMPGKSHYYIGIDQKKWHTNIPQYGKVKVKDVYPGIDVVFYGKNEFLEFDFIVRPGADPKQIKIAYENVEKVSVNKEGYLVVNTSVGKIIHRPPLIYQKTKDKIEVIEGRYVFEDLNQVSFFISKYDDSKELVIDPVLMYSTYLYGEPDAGDDRANDIAAQHLEDADGE